MDPVTSAPRRASTPPRHFGPAAPVAPGLLRRSNSLDSGAGCDHWRSRIYEAIARHEPLHSVLPAIAHDAERILPGARVAVFQLTPAGLRAHTSPAPPGELIAAIDGLAPDGAWPAPWWPLRAELASLEQDAAWAIFRAAAAAGGAVQCWSDLLITAAGEVVGTLTIFLSADSPDLAPFGRELNEWKDLAALALEQHHLLEELYFLAHKDPLTGLWNRAQIDRLLAQALASSPQRVALIWLELTGFGRVNSILGTAISDAILIEAARRLRASVRPSDSLARVGGDEFAILLPSIAGSGEPSAVTARLQAALAVPFDVHGHSIPLAPTAGIASGSSTTDLSDVILRRARMAMESAHRNAPGSLAHFTPDMQNTSRDRLELENCLRQALPRRELFLHYQPQFCLRTGRLRGCEALLRWRQPDVGLVSPGVFIPVAEQLGLISDFGLWSLEEACRQAKAWYEAGYAVRAGVNVSPHQFQTGILVEQVRGALHHSGLPPQLLELEITESTVLENLDAAVTQMRQIQSLGVTFALDDFGSGHSSLAWLRELPVQRLKIDRRFLLEVDAGPETPILRSIIALAHELHLSAIIEGIETDEHLRRARALGCDEMQGFLRGKPAGPTQFAQLYLSSPAG